MARILKRPMFRTGGSTNEGIMTGLVDRRGYSQGPSWEEVMAKSPSIGKYYDAMSAIEQPRDTSLSQMLIQGGLNLVSGEGAGGGTLSNIAKLHDSTVRDIQNANHIAVPEKLQVGTTLFIPRSSK